MRHRLDTLVALVDAAKKRGPRNDMRPRPEGASWYTIGNKGDDNAAPDSTPVYLYDEIGGWGITAADFIRDLNAIETPGIQLHINSPGGSVFDAVAIHAALQNHAATVTTVVDGLAASAASFIAQAGDVRQIEKPGTMMIHDAAGLVYGNARDMLQMADLLNQISDTIAGIYKDRAGTGSISTWRDAMRETSWYDSAKAVSAGLADEILNDTAPPVPDGPEDRRSALIRARARVTLGG